MRIGAIAALCVAVAGCAGDRGQRGGETITYVHHGPGMLCTSCANYTVTLGPDGQGIFMGEGFAAVQGERRFRATPEQVRRFTARLRPYRPKGERLFVSGGICHEYRGTHGMMVDVTWHAALGPSSHLRYQTNCDPDRNRKMASALFAAPGVLPLADLIGQH